MILTTQVGSPVFEFLRDWNMSTRWHHQHKDQVHNENLCSAKVGGFDREFLAGHDVFCNVQVAHKKTS